MKYLADVVTLEYNAELCTGCRRCVEVCPHQVFVIENKRAAITDRDRCMECGACVKNCPLKALEVKPGVGCASAIIKGWLTGTEPSCDCSDDSSGSCC